MLRAVSGGGEPSELLLQRFLPFLSQVFLVVFEGLRLVLVADLWVFVKPSVTLHLIRAT